MHRLIAVLLILGAASPAIAQGDDWRYQERRDGVHLRILRDYHLTEGSVSREPIVVVGGSATIDGRAERDVTVVGGRLRVGPRAVILGDVVTFGGEADIDGAAQIRGEVQRGTLILPDAAIGIGPLFSSWWPLFAVGSTLLRLGIVFVVALLMVTVFPRFIGEIGRVGGGSPATAVVVGVAGQVLFVPAMVAITIALAISIIGIPLLLGFPFLLGGFALLWIGGFAAVASRLGARIRGTQAGASTAPVFDLVIGFLVICAVTLVAQGAMFGSGAWPIGSSPFAWTLRTTGWVIEWIAWTLGLGAALGWLFSRRHTVTPVSWPSTAPGLP